MYSSEDVELMMVTVVNACERLDTEEVVSGDSPQGIRHQRFQAHHFNSGVFLRQLHY